MNMDGEQRLEAARSLINTNSVHKFLGTGAFKTEFRTMIRETRDYERGYLTTFSLLNMTYHIRHPLTMGPNYLDADNLRDRLAKNAELPVIFTHTHNLEEFGNPNAWVPSEEDIFGIPNRVELFNRYVDINSVSSAVIPGRQIEAWIWQTPDKTKRSHVRRAYKFWETELGSEIRYSDISRLESVLKEAGLNLIRGVLSRKDRASDFIALVRAGNFAYGLK